VTNQAKTVLLDNIYHKDVQLPSIKYSGVNLIRTSNVADAKADACTFRILY